MGIFYVNELYDKNIADTHYGVCIIGLFGDHGYEGRGNFCGWYGAEYYTNAELYAHYLAEGGGLYSPEKRISDVVVNEPTIKYDEVQIGSGYWELKIEAETLEEAINKFKNGEWRK